MEPLSWLFLALVFVVAVVGIFTCRAAYRSGVTDGYGYSREPRNPGYQAAGDYLRKRLAHRWPELRAVGRDEAPPKPPRGGSGVVSKPGAVIEVREVPIPPHVQDAIARNLKRAKGESP